MANETYFYPENNGGTVPAWMAAMNNGGFGGNWGGLGGGVLGFLLGLFFGNGWGGWGGNGFGGGSGAGAAGFLSSQMNNDSGRELLMNALTSQGEASRTAIQNLATMMGQDFNLVNSSVQTISGVLSNMATQQAVSVPQIINAIQSGNTALANQLQTCCCNMKTMVMEQGYQNQLRTVEQTNTLSNAITAGNQRIVDAIADLKTTTISEFCAARERDMQDKINTQGDIITQLRNQADNAAQTAQLEAYLAPLFAQVNALSTRSVSTASNG